MQQAFEYINQIHSESTYSGWGKTFVWCVDVD